MTRATVARYIVHRGAAGPAERAAPGLRELLEGVPGVSVVRVSAPEHAVVMMTEAVAAALGARHPDLAIERDVRHRPASS